MSRGGGGRKHVAIMAKRRIVKGEELSYDYKFPWAEREENLRSSALLLQVKQVQGIHVLNAYN